MRKSLKIKIIIYLLILPSILFAQTAEEAYKELRKVQARTQVGVSYRDYPSVLAPAKYAVNMYLKSKEAQKNPQLTSKIKLAMTYYEFALTVWDFKFPKSRYQSVKHFVFKGSPEWKILEEIFPEAIKPIEEGGIVYKMKQKNIFGEDEAIFISDALNFIWNKASKELDEIENMLKSK
ncbi:MAG: hypothetical protein NZ826_05040 [Thermodesulfovibrio sp.]|nr:hypothetical protein [Thermodesulfovibrio sp.]